MTIAELLHKSFDLDPASWFLLGCMGVTVLLGGALSIACATLQRKAIVLPLGAVWLAAGLFTLLIVNGSQK